MTDKISKLSFRMFDPEEAGEYWAVSDYSPYKVVDILIDDISLLDIISEIESPYLMEEGWFDPDNSEYGHCDPKYLYRNLTEAAIDDIYSYRYRHGAELYCCSACGEAGCWSVLVHIRVEDDKVIWFDFEHNHRNWEYNLSYTFDKAQYEKAMAHLKHLGNVQDRY